MKTTPLAIALLLTALAAAPVASADPVPDVCETAKCHVEDPPAGAACRLTEVGVGTSCVYWVDGASCMPVEWGVHSPGLVVGGSHTCNVVVWVQPGEFVQVSDSAAQPCDVSPTWPGGYATCTVAGKEVTCTFWTGALLEVDPDNVSCGVGLATSAEAARPCTVEPAAARVTCTPGAVCLGDFHTDGFLRVWSQSCTLGAQVVAPLDPTDLVDVASPSACDGTNPTDITCTTPAGTCTLFLNRWSYGGCQTVLPCSEELRAEFGPYTVEASSCRVAFDIVG